MWMGIRIDGKTEGPPLARCRSKQILLESISSFASPLQGGTAMPTKGDVGAPVVHSLR